MSVLEQLTAYCPCVEAGDVTEADVAELINVVSMATCWQRISCETFLKGARREVIDLPSCADCPVTFEPYYQPFIGVTQEVVIDEETGEPKTVDVPFGIDDFKFYLVKTQGIEETVTEIPRDSWMYSNVDGLFRINPGLPPCRCGCNPCNECPPEYRLVVEYEAGYDELPECILPVLCNVLDVILAKRNCDCANDCGCENQEEQVRYATGDVVSVALETDIGKMLVENYKNQLGLISLCRGRKYLWGVVV